MKGYRNFMIVFALVLAGYVTAELNKPRPIDWKVTLSKDDKNPYGGYILYSQLKSLFPEAVIETHRTPVYNQVNNSSRKGTAYMLIGSSLSFTKSDFDELKKYVANGNYVFASALNFNDLITDSLGFETFSTISLLKEDSTSVNFVNPKLKSKKNYISKRSTIDEYFLKIDTARSVILGINNINKPNFIKIQHGAGAFFVHAAPLCFSNYFMLLNNNAAYSEKALSYLPKNTKHVYWDEYSKLGALGARTPLRFFLNNDFLRWALMLSIAGLLIYVLFAVKRKQRVIPVISPLKNTTLGFIKTVSSVYYNQKDNNTIASKKITYFLDYVRNRFYLPTQTLDDVFVQQLSRKSGVEKNDVSYLVQLLEQVNTGYPVSDKQLFALNQHIENFYKQAK